MQCDNTEQVLSREQCYNRWPEFPCYSRHNRACYDIQGTTQLFDPVSDTLGAASNAYIMLMNFASRLLADRDVPNDPQVDQRIRETIHAYGPAFFGGPITTAVPEAVRGYIPEAIRPVGPVQGRVLQTDVPMIHLAENIGPGMRYTTVRDVFDTIDAIRPRGADLERQISPDDRGEGKKRRRNRKPTRKKRKCLRKKKTRR